MAPSTRERAVSAAGREIERALGAERSADTLTRWMSYRLAEVRLAVEHAKDPAEKKAAQAEQDALILQIWNERSALPAKVGFERELGDAIALINTLLAKDDPWRFAAPQPRNPEEFIEAMRAQMRSLTTTAAVLLFKRQVAADGPADPDLPLSEEERGARDSMTRLAELLLQRFDSKAIRSGGEPLTDEQAVKRLEHKARQEIDAFVELLRQFKTLMSSEAEGGSKG